MASKRKATSQDLRKQKNLSFDPPYPLSRDWRVRSSSIPEVELKYVQEACQSFVDVLVGRGYKVIWKGQDKVPGFTRLDKPLIYISYGPIEGEAPANPKRVDVVAGIGVHEAGHTKLTNVRGRTEMDQVANILEDCWIDYNTVSDHPVLGAYIQRTRDYYRRDSEEVAKKRLQHQKPLGRNEVIALWIYQTLYEVEVFDLLTWRTDPDQPFIVECLTSLITISVEGIKSLHKDARTYQRLYNSAMKALEVYDLKTKALQDAWLAAHPPEVVDAQGSAGSGTGLDYKEDDDLELDDFEDWGDSEGIGAKPTRGDDEEEDEEEESEEEEDGAGGSSDEIPDLEAIGPQVGKLGDEDDEEGHGHADEHLHDAMGEGDEAGEHGEDTDMHTHLPMGNTSKANQDGSDEAPEDLTPSTCMDEMLKEMPKGLAEKVWEAQEHEAEDVSAIAGSTFRMEKPGKTKPFQINDRHADAVRQAFESRRHMNTLRYPFQDSGRLSHRTLPLIWQDRKDLFEEEVTEDEIDVALGLLIDASGSIGTGGHWSRATGGYVVGKGQWEMIMETCQMCVDAFKEGQLDLFAMAYTSGICHRLYEPGWDEMRTQDVHPSGGTPSVSGLKVLMSRMEKLAGHRRDKMIVHMTDGEPNDGGGPDAMRQTVEAAERKGLVVIGIGVGVPEAALERQYKRYFSIEEFTEVPAKLQAILEKV